MRDILTSADRPNLRGLPLRGRGHNHGKSSGHGPDPCFHRLSAEHPIQDAGHAPLGPTRRTVAAQGSQAFTHFFPNAEIGVDVAPAGTTPFAKVYREALITHLVAYGVPVSFSP